MRKDFCLILVITGFLVLGFSSFAKTDLSLTATDITFSKEKPLQGDKVRIFARVFNVGGEDVYGFVVFSLNGKEIADPQPISVKENTYDDVFVDWVFAAGNFQLQAKIIATQPADEDPANDIAIEENYFVDLDTDQDKIGNSQDLDDDNDDLPDEREIVLGTNSLKSDSDGDKAKDSIDPFPLNAKEWQDSDNDGLGDNIDADDDNDGLSDDEELFVYGTNPQNPDTDNDGLSDKKEISLGTNVLQPQKKKIDFRQWGIASVFAAIKDEISDGNPAIHRLSAAFGYLSAFWLILRYRQSKKSSS